MGFANFLDEETQYFISIVNNQSVVCEGDFFCYFLHVFLTLSGARAPFNVFSLAVVVGSGVTFLSCFVIIIVTIIMLIILSCYITWISALINLMSIFFCIRN